MPGVALYWFAAAIESKMLQAGLPVFCGTVTLAVAGTFDENSEQARVVLIRADIKIIEKWILERFCIYRSPGLKLNDLLLSYLIG
jgi:hypothetical protein